LPRSPSLSLPSAVRFYLEIRLSFNFAHIFQLEERTKTEAKTSFSKLVGGVGGTDLNLAPAAEVEEGSDPPILLLV
jgi:hypothetical protein